MRISYVSLFPEVINHGLAHSLVGKARDANLVELDFVQLRDFAKDKHKSVDDIVYGGGAGMLLKAQVLYDAWASVAKPANANSAAVTEFLGKTRTILLSPQGKLLTQEGANRLATEFEHLIFVCGHYEGVDERFIEVAVDEELSIGDYILTGGEFAALVASDVIIRLIPSVVGNADSIKGDSLENGLLKAPQYTRPREFMGKPVPEILLSGNHSKIDAWRLEQSKLRTESKRLDLWEKVKNRFAAVTKANKRT